MYIYSESTIKIPTHKRTNNQTLSKFSKSTGDKVCSRTKNAPKKSIAAKSFSAWIQLDESLFKRAARCLGNQSTDDTSEGPGLAKILRQRREPTQT